MITLILQVMIISHQVTQFSSAEINFLADVRKVHTHEEEHLFCGRLYQHLMLNMLLNT